MEQKQVIPSFFLACSYIIGVSAKEHFLSPIEKGQKNKIGPDLRAPFNGSPGKQRPFRTYLRRIVKRVNEERIICKGLLNTFHDTRDIGFAQRDDIYSHFCRLLLVWNLSR
jgi:hypothetical protein